MPAFSLGLRHDIEDRINNIVDLAGVQTLQLLGRIHGQPFPHEGTDEIEQLGFSDIAFKGTAIIKIDFADGTFIVIRQHLSSVGFDAVSRIHINFQTFCFFQASSHDFLSGLFGNIEHALGTFQELIT